MQLLWLSLVAAGIVHVNTVHFSKSAPYGPLCWGPGVWPHPEHCRLFTICQLKYQVKGQLYACPEDTGFSIKHLRCMPEAKVPGCRQSPPFSDKKLLESTAVKFSSTAVKPEQQNLCYKNKTSKSFCMDDVTLVVCGPREAFMGTVDCTTQSEVALGRCDKDTKSCSVEKPSLEEEDDQDHRPSSTPPPQAGGELTTTVSSSSTSASPLLEDHQPSSSVTVPLPSTPSPLYEEQPPTPLHFENLQNITAALLEEIANSNLTLFDKEKFNESTTTSQEEQSTTVASEGPKPTLPSTSEILCKVPGLQCYDNVTIMDCPDDDTEPNFVMSCSNIIQTSENATGYCNTENPACVLLIENFMLNMEISSFSFGDSDSNNQELGYAEIDEDYEGPELYDSDNLRESPDDIFDGLSWFRHENKGSRGIQGQDVLSSNRRGKYLSKADSEQPEKENTKNSKDTFGKFESHKTPDSAFHADLLRQIHSAKLEQLRSSVSRDERATSFLPTPQQKIKRTQTINARPAARDVLEKFLNKCEEGGLFCVDNTTLVACSDDANSQMYALQCYGEATSANGRRLHAYCDQTKDSCVVNVEDDSEATGEDTMSANVEVLSTSTTRPES